MVRRPRRTGRAAGLSAASILAAMLALATLTTVTMGAQSWPGLEGGEQGFRPLFNGRDLGGWSGDPDLWTVEGGAIVGSSDGRPLSENSFLIADGFFRDFELRFQVKLRNGNSGMQVRSERTGDWGVRGYQVDFASGKGWGNLHGEGLGRGLILDAWQDKSEFLVRREWNDIGILCVGYRIRVTINGVVVNDVLDPGALEGVVALQLHRGEAMRVEARNIRIRELPAR